jgi:methylmalonyl-CoA mutase N-terminal domain/subunit
VRTQQVIAYESGVTATVDPLAGSYFVESLTDALEEKAESLISAVSGMGGAVAAIEAGWMQSQVEESAYREARRQTSGESVVVGVNRFQGDGDAKVPVLEIDPNLEKAQREALRSRRADRDQAEVEAKLKGVEEAAVADVNLMPPMKEALASGATIGEVSDALRRVFGVHRPNG